MQDFQRGLARIIHGPTGGLLMSLALAAFLGGIAIAAPGRSSLAASSDARGSVENLAAGEALGAGQRAGAPVESGPTAGSDLASDVRPQQHGWPPALVGGGNRATDQNATSRDHNDGPDSGGQGGNNTRPDAHDAGQAPNEPPSDQPTMPNQPTKPQQPSNPNQAATQGERHGGQQGPAAGSTASPGARATGGSGSSHRV